MSLTPPLAPMQFPLLPLLPLASAAITISPTFHTLGPFPLGTREAEWGSDPLSLHPIPGDHTGTFSSALGTNGEVAWGTQEFKSNTSTLVVAFPYDDEAVRQTYGWTAAQTQGWAVGWIEIDSAEEVAVVVEILGAIEFRIGGEGYFGGDMYAFGRSAAVVRGFEGRKELAVRVTGDVRALGAVGEAVISIGVREASGGLVLAKSGWRCMKLWVGRWGVW